MSKPIDRAAAVEFAKDVILRSTDWQEVQHALADSRFRAWIDAEAGNDEGESISICLSIINEAEDALGDNIPAGYA